MDLDKFDVRIRQRNLRKGALSQKDLDAYHAALPDAADNAEYIDYEHFFVEQDRMELEAERAPRLDATQRTGTVDDADDLDDEDEDEDEADDDVPAAVLAQPLPAEAPRALDPAREVSPSPTAVGSESPAQPAAFSPPPRSASISGLPQPASTVPMAAAPAPVAAVPAPVPVAAMPTPAPAMPAPTPAPTMSAPTPAPVAAAPVSEAAPAPGVAAAATQPAAAPESQEHSGTPRPTEPTSSSGSSSEGSGSV